MKIFLSWSGPKSLKAAQAFAEWLPCVIQKAAPWLSSKDIDRGSVWFSEIFSQLSSCSHGIVFITSDNKDKPWLLFESGALSKGLTENRVCTFLVDVGVRDIESSSPLSHLNHTLCTKDSVRELVHTINRRLEAEAISEPVLLKIFEALWPELETKIAAISKEPSPEQAPSREDSDVLNDILENVLSINRNIRRGIRHTRYIDEELATSKLNALFNLGLPKSDVFAILDGLVPTSWLHRKISRFFPDEDAQKLILENDIERDHFEP